MSLFKEVLFDVSESMLLPSLKESISEKFHYIIMSSKEAILMNGFEIRENRKSSKKKKKYGSENKYSGDPNTGHSKTGFILHPAFE